MEDKLRDSSIGLGGLLFVLGVLLEPNLVLLSLLVWFMYAVYATVM